ncbi:hypothetical protein OG271_06270 [Micromonospora rifamycinica]|uniref:hypothetical protein n=1 Tax=Micromonospora rifamycinica TaxID=291594 RepID=UPI002E2A4DB1|nr:hypothetical protein [Micromonospora rifamycinica]
MQTVGPYALHRKLSSCELGEVWAARDTAERPFTVAVLAPAAAEGGWREAFAAAANTLARSDGLPITGANHTGPVPWVACAADQGAGAAHVFLALGQRLTPAGQPPPVGAGQQPVGAPGVTAPVRPTAGAGPAGDPPTGRPGGGAPSPPADGPGVAVAAAPAAGPATAGTAAPAGAAPAGAPRPSGPTPPQPVPQPPAPPRGMPVAQRAGPHQAVPYPHPPAASRPMPAGTPAGYPPAGARGRGRTGVWSALVALVVLVAAVVGAAGGFGVARWSDGGRGGVAGTAAPTPSADLGLPETPPRQPGVEPPVGGGWPTAAPTFAGTDPTREISGLAGVDFSFRVPTGWSCTEAARTSGSAHYRCGVPAADGSIIGGDLVVRQCPRLCTDERRTALRRQEEAWGLQWVRSGEFTTWAETSRVDGAPRYGLVYLSYWRSVPEDAIDRQLVLRMTAPLDRADEVRKVAASVREATFTI